MNTSTPRLPASRAEHDDPRPARHPLAHRTPSPDRGSPAPSTLVSLFLLVTAVIVAGRLLHVAAPSAWSLVAAATVWALASAASWITVIAGAGLSWILATGFLEHHGGELTTTGADRGHALVLALAALVALLVRARRVGRDG